MLRLSDKLPGPSWRAIIPVSFNIFSSTNPDMITVYYYPKDATADSVGDDNFTSFKKQLVNLNVLKNSVKSIDYIDDEDDVIHIDSEQEFMEAVKFAKAYKEKNGQSIFLLIDEKSERVANSENAKISTDDDKAELMEEESKVDVSTSQQSETVTQNDSKPRYNNINKKSKLNKPDDKSEPNACCINYLEQFKQEITAEVTKNVLKKLSSALNPSEIDAEIKNEDSHDKLNHDTPQLSNSDESSLGNHNFSLKTPSLSDFTWHQGPVIPTNPANKYDSKNDMNGSNCTIFKPLTYTMGFPIPQLGTNYLSPNNFVYEFMQSHPQGFQDTEEYAYLPRSETSYGDELRKVKKEDLKSQRTAAISTPAEKKSSNDQKKKPKITNLVVLKRDDLAQKQESIIDQLKKFKSKRSNVLEMKSTIKKIAAPSPKKSSSSKIKNKSKIEKELALNAKMLSSLKLDSEEVQKTGGCKRKSHSTDENHPDKSYSCDDSLNSPIQSPPNAITFETYEKPMSKNLERERHFRASFLQNMRIFPNSSVIPVKDEAKDAKDNVKETWSQDANQSDGEVNDKIVLDQDELQSWMEQSTSDDISTLSETSSLSGVSENNFELVYYDEETNNVDVKAKKRGSSSLDTKENSDTKNTYADSVKKNAGSVKIKPTKTKERSKKFEDLKKEVRFDVVVEDIGPENESEELIPELTKRPGGDYSYVRETLPKAKEAVAETSEATEKNTKKESDCNKQQNIKTFTDKKSQHNNPSYSTTVPNVSSSCFVVHPSAPKAPKTQKKLRELEKSMKQTKKEFKEAEKKLWAYHEKSTNKALQDECTPRNFSNPMPSCEPLYPTYSTSASYNYPNDPKHNPDPFSYRYLHSRRHSNPTRMPPMYSPPPTLYEQHFSPQVFDPYVPMATTLENIAQIAFQSISANGFDPLKSFHENVASKAGDQAYAHARKAVDNYFSKQNEKR